MIILVLILALVVLWAIVLGPSLLEKRKGSPANSIVAFNNRLSVLASTQNPDAPPSQAPTANRPMPGQFVRPSATAPQRTSFPPPGSTITIVTGDGRPVENPPVPRTSFEGPAQSFPVAPQAQAPMPGVATSSRGPGRNWAPSSHEKAQQLRRKQVLQVLLLLAGGTFVLGLLPGARVILLLSLVFMALLGGYVYLLLSWKQNRLEQGRKVRHLRSTEPLAPAGAIIEGESDEGLRLVSGESQQ